MDSLFSQPKLVINAVIRHDDDFVDRLHHFYTGVLLVLFSVTLSARQSIGEALVCWDTSSPFTDEQKNYITSYCWISNTWFQPLEELHLHEVPVRYNRELSYYQWIPFVLLLQAFCFYFPALLWRGLSDTSAIHIKDIVKNASNTTVVSDDDRKATIEQIAYHIDVSLRSQRLAAKSEGLTNKLKSYVTCLMFCGRRYGNFLYIMYIIVKLFFLANVVAQFFILTHFLQTGSLFFGAEFTAEHADSKTSWKSTGIFPRITFCDFEIRVLGNLHRHTVQCVLPVNLYIEKIFVFLWWWFLLMLLLSILSICQWLVDIAVPTKRDGFMRKYLKMSGRMKTSARDKEGKKANRTMIHRFINDYLRTDGVFVLVLIKRNSGELAIGDIIDQLYDDYAKQFLGGDSRTDSTLSSEPFHEQ